jgi:hypothetical protein
MFIIKLPANNVVVIHVFVERQQQRWLYKTNAGGTKRAGHVFDPALSDHAQTLTPRSGAGLFLGFDLAADVRLLLRVAHDVARREHHHQRVTHRLIHLVRD